MPSGPYALFVLREESTLRTLRSDIIGGGIGLLRGRLGGGAALESSREELVEKREPNRLAFSVGETAIEPPGLKRGGKLDLQKLLRMFLVKDQKERSVGEVVRQCFFRNIKPLFALRITVVQRFLAALKTWKVSREH